MTGILEGIWYIGKCWKYQVHKPDTFLSAKHISGVKKMFSHQFVPPFINQSNNFLCSFVFRYLESNFSLKIRISVRVRVRTHTHSCIKYIFCVMNLLKFVSKQTELYYECCHWWHQEIFCSKYSYMLCDKIQVR